MLRYVLTLIMLLVVGGCTSHPPQTTQQTQALTPAENSKIALSHVQAYLLIGNLEKAQERFQTINNPESMPQAVLALAELRAASGDVLGAQQAFVLASNDLNMNKQQVSPALLEYLCEHRKWPVLQGYAKGLIATQMPVASKNMQLTTIGLCFFNQQQWADAHQWLNELDLSQPVYPMVYLALARFNVEQQQNESAQQLINKFETTKTKVDAQILWHSFEIYSALQQSQLAQQAAQQLMQLFPYTLYARHYIRLTKRLKNHPNVASEATTKTKPTTQAKPTETAPQQTLKTAQVHLIKQGETLYRLSKRYNVSVSDLLKWNPSLVIDDIPLGTAINVTEPE